MQPERRMLVLHEESFLPGQVSLFVLDYRLRRDLTCATVIIGRETNGWAVMVGGRQAGRTPFHGSQCAPERNSRRLHCGETVSSSRHLAHQLLRIFENVDWALVKPPTGECGSRSSDPHRCARRWKVVNKHQGVNANPCCCMQCLQPSALQC